MKFILFKIFLRAETSINDSLKCKAKVLREHRIYEGVDGGVAVAQPKQNGKQNLVDAVVAEWTYEV